MSCALCDSVGGELVWENALCRVVLVEDPQYPGFCRVILKQHEKEMSDLSPADQQTLMQVVFAVEAALRRLMHPDKINLASLGNVVPHLHWHVIPRFADDAHYPQAVWAAPLRTSAAHPKPVKQDLRRLLDDLLQTPYDYK